MRLAFVNGDTRPGRDGVGDYTRLLARRLEARGLEVGVFALNVRGEPSEAFGRLALSAERPWPERLAQARAALAAFAPDVVSLQFVPHAWHARGVPLRKARDLAGLLAPWPGTITLHELWYGSLPPAGLKERAYRAVQRPLTLWLARRFAPDGVLTTNAAYCEVLSRHGITAAVLPLMGNVPPHPGDRVARRRSVLARIAPDLPAERSWLCGVFGGRPPWLTDAVTWRRLQGCARQAERSLAVALLGAGVPSTAELAAWQAAAPAVPVAHLGALPEAELSQTLAALDLGLSPTRRALIGKSGSATALMEHGVPVVSLYPGDPVPTGSLPPALAPLFLGDLEAAAPQLASGALPRGEIAWTGEAVVDAFLAHLECRLAAGGRA